MGVLGGTTTAGVGAGVDSVADGEAADGVPPVADRGSAAPAAPGGADTVATGACPGVDRNPGLDGGVNGHGRDQAEDGNQRDQELRADPANAPEAGPAPWVVSCVCRPLL